MKDSKLLILLGVLFISGIIFITIREEKLPDAVIPHCYVMDDTYANHISNDRYESSIPASFQYYGVLKLAVNETKVCTRDFRLILKNI